MIVISLNYDYCAAHECYVNPRFGCYRCQRAAAEHPERAPVLAVDKAERSEAAFSVDPISSCDATSSRAAPRGETAP